MVDLRGVGGVLNRRRGGTLPDRLGAVAGDSKLGCMTTHNHDLHDESWEEARAQRLFRKEFARAEALRDA